MAKPDIFNQIKYDLIQDVKFDVLDAVDLDTEDKVIYSKELKELLREELAKKIAEIPLDRIIKDIVSKQLDMKDYPSMISKKTEDLKNKIDQENLRSKYQLKEELEKLSKEIKEKYAEFRNILNSQERYTFGGFAPPNPLTGAAGTVLSNTDQTWNGLAWSAPSSSGGAGSDPFYIGDENTDGSWRFIVSGSDLSFERRESGTWVSKGMMTA